MKRGIRLIIIFSVIAWWLGCFQAFAQTRQVKVLVSDALGPLAGAGVVVQGTGNGTVTDADGVATLNVPQGASVEVSMIGYATQAVPVNGQSSLSVVLAEDAVMLEEVVFIGYGTAKKKDLTGSVAKADIETFRHAPNTSIMESLHGTVPGLNIGQVNSAGAEPSIEVRGQVTINGSTDPLVVLDGIIYTGRISDVNPSDIESVEVLKDASSKAVYGAQAANGVIIITTKTGKREAAPRITYNGNFAFSEPTVRTRLLNRKEWLARLRDIEYESAYTRDSGYTEINPDWDYTFSQLTPKTIQGITNGLEYDWWDACTNVGHNYKHSVTVSGGSKRASYYLSGSHSDVKGVTMNDIYRRNTLRMNMDVNVTDWLKLGTNTFLAFLDYSGESPNIGNILLMNPVVSPFVSPEDGNWELEANPTGIKTLNPFIQSRSMDLEKKHQVNTTVYGIITVPWVSGLQYRVNYSYRLNASNSGNFNIYKDNLQGHGEKSYGNDYYWLLDNILSYNRSFNRHNLGLTFVYGCNKREHDATTAAGTGYDTDALGYNSLELATTHTISSSGYEESSLYQMGRVSYNYAGKYLFNATLRRDGFSGFAENHKFGWFPSVGIGWVASEEAFMKKFSWLSQLKLRVSYGRTGNQTSRYSSLARMSSANYVFGDGASTSVGYSLSKMENPNLKWETTDELNAGVDFGFLNGRISGSVDYYNSLTKDLLWDMTIPSASGFTVISTNIGKIRNNGVEITLAGIPLRIKDFEWNISTVFSSNRNRIVSLLGEDNDGDGKEDDLVASGLFIGEPIGTVYGYQVDGMWQLDDIIPVGWYPGTYKLHDFGNGDYYEITPAQDRVILGHTEPAWRMGITNRFRYKNLSLSFMFNIVNGGKDGFLGANGGRDYTTVGNAEAQNEFTFTDFWSPRNPDGKFARTWVTPTVAGTLYQQRNFVRLQDISLTYTLGKKLAKKIGAENLAFSISGKNLLTFTKWVGWDPELGVGAGHASRPVMRSYSFGIDLTF
ncbi:MAG: TonB-dependent receptor [Bacteroidales bacterium]|nr:TonB-dependent receptor [Bacteroidales bacterium]